MDQYSSSIHNEYKDKIWNKFLKAIDDYKLITPGDKICVCISGGKDSMLMAKLFMEYQKIVNTPLEVKYLVMNPGYNQLNFEMIQTNIKKLQVPATIIETNIFDVANSQEKNPCYLCAKMRRGALYNLAKKLGCNKIALGHHYDDVIETTLMNMLNSGSFQTMLPKLKSTNYEGMELIRPLFLIREKDIIDWKKDNDLTFIQCACRFTENIAEEEAIGHNSGSQRKETKKLIECLTKEYNPEIEKMIFQAGSNINVDSCLGFKEKEDIYTFLNDYDQNQNYKK